MEISIKSNPFTPKSGMEPKVFLGREKELKVFEKQLRKASQSIYNHFLILGDWGIGKTTLLKEYKKIAQLQNILAAYVPVREFIERELLSATIHLITQITRSLPIRFEKLRGFREYLNGLGITLPVIGGGITFAEGKTYQGDPQVLLLDALTKLWKELKRETDTVIVLLDDVQSYQVIPEFLTLLRNVLSYEEIVRDTGFLFILASTYQGWAQFMQKSHPIGRYFIPIVRLKNLGNEKTMEILDKTLEDTGVIFEETVKKRVFEYTEGHPFQMQVLCDYLYENQVEGKVCDEVWEIAFTMTLEDLGEIILDHLYSSASSAEREILDIMAKEYKLWRLMELFDEIRRMRGTIENKGTLGKSLERLVEKDLVTKLERGSYRLPNRIFSEYLLRR